MLPFWLSIAVLSLVQGATVAGPSRQAVAALARLRSRWWAAVAPASVVGFVLVASLAAHASAQALTYLALGAVPLLAAFALGRLRPVAALLVAPLFALAWADRGGLAGEAAAVTLSALSCVTLGVLLGALTPARWLAVGIVLMACADTALVISDLLQRPNDVLNAAHPVAGLPRLQSAALGDAVMGYGDLFAAGLLGGLLAATSDRARQLRGAALVAGLALGFDLLFFAVNELPATVPVALATILTGVGRREGEKMGPERVEHVGMSEHRQLPLKPQVYVDERPEEYFERFYDWAQSRRPGFVYDLARLLLTPLCMVLFRARCLGADNVPRSGPAILAPNHFSTMDHFFCGLYLRRRVRFMAKSQLFRGVLQWILYRGGAFPVQRGRHDERAIATALAILADGGLVVIYPEGGRSRSGRIGERGARAGVGRLALESGVPIVPVAIHGSLRARNWKRLEFPRVTVRYGEPLRSERVAHSSHEAQRELADEVLDAVKELYGQLEGAAGERRGRVRRRARTPAVR